MSDDVRIGSLFSGYEGLGMGVQAVLGGTVAWHSDIDPGACKILAHRYPDVPNIGDITTVDWSAVEPVDVLTGGFPCQDVSCAGLHKGLRPDTRSGLWTQMAHAIDQLRPALVVAENVRGLLSAEAHSDLEPCPWCVGDGGGVPLRALGAVLGDLADLGYDASWQGLRAADVGAPHARFRVFVVAWPAADAADHDGHGRAAAGAAGRGARLAAAYADGSGLEGRERSEQEHSRLALGSPAGDTSLRGRHGARSAGGREEPTRPTRGSGVATADTHSDALRQQPVALAGSGSAPVAGHAGADAAAYPSSDGRHKGRPEPTRLIGGSDAALCGDAPADPDRDGLGGLEGAPRGRDAVWADERDDADRCGDGTVADAACPTGQAPQGLRTGSGETSGAGAAGVAGGRDPLRDVDWGAYGPAIRRWEGLTRPAPAPTEPGAKGQPRLSPKFVEWMQGLPAGWVTDVPGLTRNEQLKALGNGCVPQQVGAALRLLLADQMEAAA